MSLNINGNSNDSNYRYKMPQLKSQYAGRGNGSFTILTNIDDVAKSLCHPPHVLFRFIGKVLGSNCNEAKKSITGHHKNNDLIDVIYQYINYFVICPQCSIPELIPNITGKKKNKKIEVRCSACGHTDILKSKGKQFDKGLELLIKHIEKNGWTIVKGNTVDQDNKSEFDPFTQMVGIDDSFTL